MKCDELEFKVRNYLRKGTEILKTKDVTFNIIRNHRENYIGISNLTACSRLIWMKYFYPERIIEQKIEDSSIRIFDLGHLIEDVTLKTLIAGGASLNDAQQGFSDFNGILRGHLDSILDKENVLEIKSMNDHSFESFVALGVKVSHFTYYVQVQLYMYYSGLRHAVIVATNKNNSKIECEHVLYDEETVNYHLQKIKIIVETTNFFSITHPYIPDSIEKCRFCVLNNICHSKVPTKER